MKPDKTSLLYVFISIFGLDRAQTTKDFSLEEVTDRNVPVKIFSYGVNVAKSTVHGRGPSKVS